MVLVDTSVWVSHFRYGNCHLEKLLNNEAVMCYPFVIGELAYGNMKNRDRYLISASPSVAFTAYKKIAER